MGKSERIVIVLGQNVSPALAHHECAHSYVVGVDAGALYCVKNHIHMDEAIGDFDSVSQSAFLTIISSGAKLTRLPIEKDVTDTEFALSKFPKQEVLILGGIHGPRVEHALTNFFLLSHYPKAVFLDDFSKVFYLPSGKEITIYKEGYRFLSVFPFGEVSLRQQGLHYDYPESMMSGTSLGVSNEFEGKVATLESVLGDALIILTKDDKVEI